MFEIHTIPYTKSTLRLRFFTYRQIRVPGDFSFLNSELVGDVSADVESVDWSNLASRATILDSRALKPSSTLFCILSTALNMASEKSA